MLITFRTVAAGNIVMFGDIATQLIQFMGHSGQIPGALQPEDLPHAIQLLKTAIEDHSSSDVAVNTVAANESSEDTEDNDELNVSLQNRAFPLIQLLEAAEREQVPVIWD